MSSKNPCQEIFRHSSAMMMLTIMPVHASATTLLTLGCLLIVATTAQATTKQDLVAVQMFTHVW
jgi:hypothetical protein